MRLRLLLSIIMLFIVAQIATAQDEEVYRERWQVKSTLLLDTCGGAAAGAKFPIVMHYNMADELVFVKWFAQEFNMSPNMLPHGYGGVYYGVGSTYVLNVMFDDDPDTFYAILSVEFDAIPGCVWLIRWDGVPM